MKLDNRQTQTIGYIKTERNPADHIACYQDFVSPSKNDSWIFGPSFLHKEPCFEMNNNNIPTHQTKTLIRL